jgi:hypothetical protein
MASKTKPTSGARQVDGKGRLPEREIWLHENSRRKRAVLKGIDEARRSAFCSSPPDIAEDAALAREMEDSAE